MRINKLLSYGGASLFAALLLGGCGGGDSAPVPEVFPRKISYKALTGEIKGDVLRLTTEQMFSSECFCLSSFTALTTKELFQSYVTQSPNSTSARANNVLAAGNAVDFAQEQIWAFKYGKSIAGLILRLDIKETATQIEVQANVCNTVGVDAPPTFFSVFAIVPRNFVTKPIVILNDLYLPMPCYT